MAANKEVLDAVLRAQEDKNYFDALVESNRKFVTTCTSKALGRSASEKDVQEALKIFKATIYEYDGSQGEFRAFAEKRIAQKMRVNSSTVSEAEKKPVVHPSSQLNAEEDARVQARMQEQGPAKRMGTPSIKDEIERLQEAISRYDFTLFELADNTPEQGKERTICADAIVLLAEDKELFAQMRTDKELPIADIREEVAGPKKVFKENREYIIAVAEIMHGDYPRLREYFDYIRKALRA